MDQASSSNASQADTSLDMEVVVSGKVFSTTRSTLTKSPFFRRHLSDPANYSTDGDITVQADPELFGHILNYLEEGAYPIILRTNGTHDIAKYVACLKEARYFHLERLADWLERARYAEAVKLSYPPKLVCQEEDESTDTISWLTLSMPIDITNSNECDHQWAYDKLPAFYVLMVKKTLRINHDLLRDSE